MKILPAGEAKALADTYRRDIDISDVLDKIENETTRLEVVIT